MSLTDAQREQLLRPINPRRVGTDGKGFAHLEAYDVRAHLSRIFGIGAWSCRVLVMEQVFESMEKDRRKKDKQGKEYGDPYDAWTVCYRAQVELVVADAVYTEWATGDATNMPSRADAHDMAIKTAESQALKRCAVNLGDQFGLSLYAKGSTAAVVKAVIPWASEPVEVEHEVVAESLERPGMPAKDVQTNGHSEPSATSPDAQAIWDEAEALAAKPKVDALTGLAKLNVTASQHKMRNSLVTVGDEVRSLGAALDHALKVTTGRPE